MCFRTKQTATAQQLEHRFDVKLIDPKLNVQNEKYFVFEKPLAPVIANNCLGAIQLFQWGLIPDKIGATANAKIETITDKFKNYTHQKCLVLVNGFYEKKRLITMPDNQPFALAGLWSVQKHGEGIVYTFTVITTESKGEISNFHRRMPVILKRENEMDWLMGRSKAKLFKDVVVTPPIPEK